MMKDDTKHAELPPQPQPADVAAAKVKEGQAPPDTLRNLAVGTASTPAAHVTLLGNVSAALPANARPLAGMVEHLQHQYGNTYVQRLVSEVKGAQSDDVAHDKQAAPTSHQHAHEIAPLPPHGTIDAAGCFAVPYIYDLASVGDSLVLTLVVPAGVIVTALPLTYMNRSDYDLTDPGSTHPRAVTIAVSTHVPTPPKMQVTLTQGNFTYAIAFHFRRASIPPPAPKMTESAEGDVEK
jgi:hypothetical protein